MEAEGGIERYIYAIQELTGIRLSIAERLDGSIGFVCMKIEAGGQGFCSIAQTTSK
jgi:hypothetical protein